MITYSKLPVQNWRINYFNSFYLKKTFIYIMNVLIIVIGFSCNKKEQTPKEETQPQPVATAVYCIYQMDLGKAFLFCAKTEDEYKSKVTQYQNAGLNISTEIKTDCNQCQ